MEKIRLEQTTAVGIRGMRGMSSVDKKLVSQSGTTLFGTAKVPTTPPLNEFSCVCATGWTGPTCEISKCIKFFMFCFSIFSCALWARMYQRIADRTNEVHGEIVERRGTKRKVIIKSWFQNDFVRRRYFAQSVHLQSPQLRCEQIWNRWNSGGLSSANI